MNDRIWSYVARKVVEDLRQGTEFDEDAMEAFAQAPLHDFLRREVEEHDIELASKLLLDKRRAANNLGHVLLRPFLHIPAVRELIEDVWREPHDSWQRMSVVYDLCEFISDREFWREVKQFLNDECVLYRQRLLAWWGGEQGILEGNAARLADPRFHHKRWLYIYSLGYCDAARSKEARILIESYLGDPDPWVREAARESLQTLQTKGTLPG